MTRERSATHMFSLSHSLAFVSIRLSYVSSSSSSRLTSSDEYSCTVFVPVLFNAVPLPCCVTCQWCISAPSGCPISQSRFISSMHVWRQFWFFNTVCDFSLCILSFLRNGINDALQPQCKWKMSWTRILVEVDSSCFISFLIDIVRPKKCLYPREEKFDILNCLFYWFIFDIDMAPTKKSEKSGKLLLTFVWN